MDPMRLATVDRIRASEAARDVLDHLGQMLTADQPLPHMPRSAPETWSAEAWSVWRRYCHLWTCATVGRDPLDYSPLTADELVILRLELI